LKNPNPVIPSVEDCVRISSDPARGRELIVTRDVGPGMLLK